MAKIIRQGTVFYRSKRFLALYGDKDLTLVVSDMDENIKYTILCEDRHEQYALFRMGDAEWAHWLATKKK
jgi:hypothetical protein